MVRLLFLAIVDRASRQNCVRKNLDLSSLPLGALRKAQHALANAKPVSESEDSDSSSEDGSAGEDDARPVDLKRKEKEKPEWSLKPRKDLAKRPNKHA